MALLSPGVEVQVIDESFYTPAEPGSVPFIVIATAENKLNGAGTAVAAGTLASNSGKVFKISSQRELVDTFGVPFFEKTTSSNPVHGSERNEYGLLSAYSVLGVTNSAFIMRSNIDLNELVPDTSEPGADPRDGTWWINSKTSTWGIQEWNSNPASITGGQKFLAKIPTVFTNSDVTKLEYSQYGYRPKSGIGVKGDYAVVYNTVNFNGSFDINNEFARIWYKSNGNAQVGIEPGEWVLLGSQEWALSWPTAWSTLAVSATGLINTGDQFSINGNIVTVPDAANINLQLTALALIINNMSIAGVVATTNKGRLYLYSDGATTQASDSALSGAINLQNVTGEPLKQLNIKPGIYLAPKLEHAPHTRRPLFKRVEQIDTVIGYPSGSIWIKTTEPNQGARLRVSKWNSKNSSWSPLESPMYVNGQDAIYHLDKSGGGINIGLNTIFTQVNASENYSYRSPDNSSTTDPYTTGLDGLRGYDKSFETAEYRIWKRVATGATKIVSREIGYNTIPLAEGAKQSFYVAQSILGSNALSANAFIEFEVNSNESDAEEIAKAISAVTFYNVNGEEVTNNIECVVTVNNELVITHKKGGEIRFIKGTGDVLSRLFEPYNLGTGIGTKNFYRLTDTVSGSEYHYLASNWQPLAASKVPSYYIQPIVPVEEPLDGQLWYNPSFAQVDIMVHNGNGWVGYRNDYGGLPLTDVNGPHIGASAPQTQSTGDALVSGDLWIDTNDLEHFPVIYRWSDDDKEWKLIDKTDQTTEEGILFADARYNLDGKTNVPGSIREMLLSNFLDPDAPDPALYPKGMLLYNTRRSYGNVKRYVKTFIDTTQDNPRYHTTYSPVGMYWDGSNGESMNEYATMRWVTASPNNEDGSGNFGRKAQRSVVIQALKSAVDSSLEARDEERRNFNIMACPGYPELMSNMVNLNIDRKITSFVIGDTPLRLKPDTTSLTNWGTNALGVTDNGDDGIVTYDEYSAVYYPNGFTTDLSGASAVVPASHMMLKTMILSDQVSYPWFAPAGTRRGGITNATSVGYIDNEGEFTTVALNTSQRDTLYDLKVNPIPFFVGSGLVAYGQKTRARNASALDRINVARLVIYLRGQLTKLARPYVFEPNDDITRAEIKAAVDSLLLEMIALRAIYDGVCVCDVSNNTPARIDRNELWVDVAIAPVKAIEFIFIPLRLKNTGEI